MIRVVEEDPPGPSPPDLKDEGQFPPLNPTEDEQREHMRKRYLKVVEEEDESIEKDSVIDEDGYIEEETEGIQLVGTVKQCTELDSEEEEEAVVELTAQLTVIAPLEDDSANESLPVEVVIVDEPEEEEKIVAEEPAAVKEEKEEEVFFEPNTTMPEPVELDDRSSSPEPVCDSKGKPIPAEELTAAEIELWKLDINNYFTPKPRPVTAQEIEELRCNLRAKMKKLRDKAEETSGFSIEEPKPYKRKNVPKKKRKSRVARLVRLTDSDFALMAKRKLLREGCTEVVSLRSLFEPKQKPELSFRKCLTRMFYERHLPDFSECVSLREARALRRLKNRVVVEEFSIELSNSFKCLFEDFQSSTANYWIYEAYPAGEKPKKAGFCHSAKTCGKDVVRKEKPTCLEIKKARKPVQLSIEEEIEAFNKLVIEENKQSLTTHQQRLEKLGIDSEEYAYLAYEQFLLCLEHNPLMLPKDDQYYDRYDEWCFNTYWKIPEGASDMFDHLTDVITRALGITNACLMVSLIASLSSLVTGIILFSQVNGKLNIALAIGGIIANILSMVCVFISSRILATKVANALQQGLERVKSAFMELQTGIVDFVKSLYSEPDSTVAAVVKNEIVTAEVKHCTTRKEACSSIQTAPDDTHDAKIAACKQYVESIKPKKIQVEGANYVGKGYSASKHAYYGDHWFVPWAFDEANPQMLSIDFGKRKLEIPVTKDTTFEDIRVYLSIACEVPHHVIAVYNAENGGFPCGDRDVSEDVVGEITHVEVVKFRMDGVQKTKWGNVLGALDVDASTQRKLLELNKVRLYKLKAILEQKGGDYSELYRIGDYIGLNKDSIKSIIDDQVSEWHREQLVGIGDDNTMQITTQKLIIGLIEAKDVDEFRQWVATGGPIVRSTSVEYEANLACYVGLTYNTVKKFLDNCYDTSTNGQLDVVQADLGLDLLEVDKVIHYLLQFHNYPDVLLFNTSGEYYGNLQQKKDQEITIINLMTAGDVTIKNPAPKKWCDYNTENTKDIAPQSTAIDILERGNHSCIDCLEIDANKTMNLDDYMVVGDATVDALASLMGVDISVLPTDFAEAQNYCMLGDLFKSTCEKRAIGVSNGKVFVSTKFMRPVPREGYYFTKDCFDSPFIQANHVVSTTTLGGLHCTWDDSAGRISVPILVKKFLPSALQNIEYEEHWKNYLKDPTNLLKYCVNGKYYQAQACTQTQTNQNRIGRFWGCKHCQGKRQVVLRDDTREAQLSQSLSIVKVVACSLCVVMSIVLTNSDAKARPIDYLKNIMVGVALGGAAMSGYELFGHIFHKATESGDEVLRMNTLRKQLAAFNAIPTEILGRSPALLRASFSKIDETHTFLATHKLQTGANMPLVKLVNDLTAKQHAVLTAAAYGCTRPATFIMLITSEPGLGKNYAFTERAGIPFGTDVGCGLQRLKDIIGDEMRVKWLKTDANGYWNEMNGEHVTIYDEWGMRSEEPMMTMINQIGNNTPATFSGASIETKHQMFISDFLILLSNKATLPSTSKLNNEAIDAVRSRINHYRVTDKATSDWVKQNDRYGKRPSTLPKDISKMTWEKYSNVQQKWLPTTWNQMWYEAAVHYYNERQKIPTVIVQAEQAKLLGGVETTNIKHPKELAAEWKYTNPPALALYKDANKLDWAFADEHYNIWHSIPEATGNYGQDDNLYVSLHGPSGKGKSTWIKQVIDDWRDKTCEHSKCFYLTAKEDYQRWIRFDRYQAKAGDMLVTDDIFWEDWFNANELVNTNRGLIVVHISNTTGQFRRVKSPGMLSWESLKFVYRNWRTLWNSTNKLSRDARLFCNPKRMLHEGEIRRSGLYGNCFTPKPCSNTESDHPDDWIESSPDPKYTFEIELKTENMFYVPTRGANYTPTTVHLMLLDKFVEWRDSCVPISIVSTEKVSPTNCSVEIKVDNFDDLKELLKTPESMLAELVTVRGQSKVWCSDRLFNKFAAIPSLRGAAWQIADTTTEAELEDIVKRMFQTFRTLIDDEVVVVKIGEKAFWNDFNIIYTTNKDTKYKLLSIMKSETPGNVIIHLVPTIALNNVLIIEVNKMNIIRILLDGVYGVEGKVEVKMRQLNMLQQLKDEILDHPEMLEAVCEWKDICEKNKEQARKASKMARLKKWISCDSTTALCFKLFLTICLLEVTICGARAIYSWYNKDPVIKCIFCNGSFSIKADYARYVSNEKYVACVLCHQTQTLQSYPSFAELDQIRNLRREVHWKMIDPPLDDTQGFKPTGLYDHYNRSVESDTNDLAARGKSRQLLDQHRTNYSRTRAYIQSGAHLRDPQWSDSLFTSESAPSPTTDRHTGYNGIPDLPRPISLESKPNPLEEFARGAGLNLEEEKRKFLEKIHESGSGKIGQIAQLQRKVQKSLVRLHGFDNLWGIFVKGRRILFPFHLQESANLHGVTITAEVGSRSFLVENVHRIPDCDACIGEIKDPHLDYAQDITSHFVPVEEIAEIRKCGIMVAKVDEGTVTPTKTMYPEWQSNDNNGVPCMINLTDVTSANATARGDCGSPYYAILGEQGAQYLRFVGMHVAKLGNTAYQGCVITQERLRETLDKMDGVQTDESILLEPTTFTAARQSYETVVFVKEELTSMTVSSKPRFKYKLPLRYLGKLKSMDYDVEASRRSPWYDLLCKEFPCPLLEVDENIPRLSHEVTMGMAKNNHGKPDKIQAQLNHILENPKHLDISLEELDEMEEVFQDQKLVLNSSYGYNWDIQGPTTAMNAITVNDLQSTPLRVNKSAGFYGKMRKRDMKRDFIDVGPSGLRTFKKDFEGKLLLEYVRFCSDRIRAGKPFLTVFSLTPKREALPAEKALKGKIRMFSAASIELTIVERMYFLPIVTLITKVDGPVRTGFNELIDLGRKHGKLAETFEHCASFDFSRFDKWVTRAEVFFAVRLLCHMNYSWSHENYLFADTIAKAFTMVYCDSPVYCKGDLFQTNGTLPSGILLTNILGSLIVHMRVLRSYRVVHRMYPPANDQKYCWNVFPMECGDDLTLYCSADGVVPLPDIVRVMEENGARVTTTTKDALESKKAKWHFSFEGTSFISRTVWYNEKYKQFWSPLKESSIVKALFYARKQAYENTMDLLLDVISEARALQDIRVYDKIMRMCDIVINFDKTCACLRGQLVTFNKAHEVHNLYVKTGENPIYAMCSPLSPTARMAERTTLNLGRIASREFLVVPNKYSIAATQKECGMSYERKVLQWMDKNPGMWDEAQAPEQRSGVHQGKVVTFWVAKYVLKYSTLSLPVATFESTRDAIFEKLWKKITELWKIVPSEIYGYDQLEEDQEKKDFDIIELEGEYKLVAIRQGAQYVVFSFQGDGKWTTNVELHNDPQHWDDSAHSWRRATPEAAAFLYKGLNDLDAFLYCTWDCADAFMRWIHTYTKDLEMERGEEAPPATVGVDLSQPAIPSASNAPPLLMQVIKPQGHGEIHLDTSQRDFFVTEAGAAATSFYYKSWPVPGSTSAGDTLCTVGGDDVLFHPWFKQKYTTHRVFGGHYYVILRFGGVTNLAGVVKVVCRNATDDRLVAFQNQSIIHVGDMVGQSTSGCELVLQCNFTNTQPDSIKHQFVKKVGNSFEFYRTTWDIIAETNWGSAFISEMTSSTAITISASVALGHLDVDGFTPTIEIGGWLPIEIQEKTDTPSGGSVVGRRVGDLDKGSSMYIWSAKGATSRPLVKGEDYGRHRLSEHFSDHLKDIENRGVKSVTSVWCGKMFENIDEEKLTFVRMIEDHDCPVKMTGVTTDGAYCLNLSYPILFGTWPNRPTGRRDWLSEELVTKQDWWNDDSTQFSKIHKDIDPNPKIEHMTGYITPTVLKQISYDKDKDKLSVSSKEDYAYVDVVSGFDNDVGLNCWGATFRGDYMSHMCHYEIPHPFNPYNETSINPPHAAEFGGFGMNLHQSNVTRAGASIFGRGDTLQFNSNSVMVVDNISANIINDYSMLGFKYMTIGSQFPSVVTDGIVNAKLSATLPTPFMYAVMETLTPGKDYKVTLKHPIIAHKVVDMFLKATGDKGWMWGTQATNEYAMTVGIDEWVIQDVRELNGAEQFTFTDTSGWQSFKLEMLEEVREKMRAHRMIFPTPTDPFPQVKSNRIRVLESGDSEYCMFAYLPLSNAVKRCLQHVMAEMKGELPGEAEFKRLDTLHMTVALVTEETGKYAKLRQEVIGSWPDTMPANVHFKESDGMPHVDFLGQSLVILTDDSTFEEGQRRSVFTQVSDKIRDLAFESKPVCTMPEKGHVTLLFWRNVTEEQKAKAICSFEKSWQHVSGFCDMKTSSSTHVEVRRITVKSEKGAFNPPRQPFQKKQNEAAAGMVVGGLLGGLGQGLGAWGSARMNRQNMQWLAQFNADQAKSMSKQNFKQNAELLGLNYLGKAQLQERNFGYAKDLSQQKFDQSLQMHTLRATDRITGGNQVKDEGPAFKDASTAMMGVGATQTDGNITGMNTKQSAFFRDHMPTGGQFGTVQPFTRGTQANFGEEGHDVGSGSLRLYRRRNAGTNFGLGIPGPSSRDAATGMGYSSSGIGTQTGPAVRGRGNQTESASTSSTASGGGDAVPDVQATAATVSTATPAHVDAAAAAGPTPQAHIPQAPEEAAAVPSTPSEAATHGAPPAQHSIT